MPDDTPRPQISVMQFHSCFPNWRLQVATTVLERWPGQRRDQGRVHLTTKHQFSRRTRGHLDDVMCGSRGYMSWISAEAATHLDLQICFRCLDVAEGRGHLERLKKFGYKIVP